MPTERERLEELYSYEVLDTEQETEFENIVQLASQICGTPVSLVSLVDLNRQWFKARKGFPPSETSRSVSFCSHAILQEGIMIVPDATQDARFAHNPLVTGEPHIRFYAGAPLLSPSGHALGTLCVIDQKARNLSEEQQFALKTLAQQVMTQLELRARIIRLQELLSAKDKILSIMSHDVMGPIRNVNRLLSLFETDDVPQEKIRYLAGEMRKTLHSADHLLSNLLDWFLAQAGQRGPAYTEVHIAELAAEIANKNKELLTQKNNRLHNTIPAGITLQADPNMLSFVLRNLLLNANKFTQDGSITLTAEEAPEGWVRILVSDTGVGMTPHQLEKVFWEDHPTTTRGTANEKGHGLGLLLSKEFIDKHRGHMRLSSEVGKGTQVTIELPKSILVTARAATA